MQSTVLLRWQRSWEVRALSDLKKKADSPLERLGNGLFKENPTFVLMLGMCPTLAVTTSAMNGLGMGLATTAVLMMSNLIISLLRKVIPDRVRIPAFIVIIATFVTVVQFLMEAYLPDINKALGIYIPLIVVNCIILGRAESYAYSNPPIPSFFDGLGMGLGFSFALTCIGLVRELLGAGKAFDHVVMPASYVPINIFVLAPGAFFVLAALTALQNYVRICLKKAGKHEKAAKIQSGCNEDCMNCPDKGCSKRFYDDSKKSEAKAEKAKAAEAKAAEKKAEKAKAAEAKAAEKKAEKAKAAEAKAEKEKAAEAKAEKEKAAEAKAAEENEKPAFAIREEQPVEKVEEKPAEDQEEKSFAEIKREATGRVKEQVKEPVAAPEKTFRQIKEEAEMQKRAALEKSKNQAADKNTEEKEGVKND
ncbi:MAG: electron transport complex subunit RsxE [Lachnospiraceae bacterium]|nr:electron transport complex subunit RsxE [Lachnospiraceae bacterium]